MLMLCVDCLHAKNVVREKALYRNGKIEVVDKDYFYCTMGNFSDKNPVDKRYMVDQYINRNPQNITTCDDYDPMSEEEEDQKLYLKSLKKSLTYNPKNANL